MKCCLSPFAPPRTNQFVVELKVNCQMLDHDRVEIEEMTLLELAERYRGLLTYPKARRCCS